MEGRVEDEGAHPNPLGGLGGGHQGGERSGRAQMVGHAQHIEPQVLDLAGFFRPFTPGSGCDEIDAETEWSILGKSHRATLAAESESENVSVLPPWPKLRRPLFNSDDLDTGESGDRFSD
ncbi:hypothetical protein GCM10010207_65990 [Streptomyces atratus]|nr:hypothetical protein GCM10010207_65990 [Streptomyces atratus]